MEDILSAPVMSMAAEFARQMVWTDWRGATYSLAEEWEYVNGPAARRVGGAPAAHASAHTGVRDENNGGKLPSDFAAEVNAHGRTHTVHRPHRAPSLGAYTRCPADSAHRVLFHR